MISKKLAQVHHEAVLPGVTNQGATGQLSDTDLDPELWSTQAMDYAAMLPKHLEDDDIHVQKQGKPAGSPDPSRFRTATF